MGRLGEFFLRCFGGLQLPGHRAGAAAGDLQRRARACVSADRRGAPAGGRPRAHPRRHDGLAAGRARALHRRHPLQRRAPDRLGRAGLQLARGVRAHRGAGAGRRSCRATDRSRRSRTSASCAPTSSTSTSRPARRTATASRPLQAARRIELDRWADWGERERLVVNIATIYGELTAPSPPNPLEAFQQMAELRARRARAEPAGELRGRPPDRDRAARQRGARLARAACSGGSAERLFVWERPLRPKAKSRSSARPRRRGDPRARASSTCTPRRRSAPPSPACSSRPRISRATRRCSCGSRRSALAELEEVVTEAWFARAPPKLAAQAEAARRRHNRPLEPARRRPKRRVRRKIPYPQGMASEPLVAGVSSPATPGQALPDRVRRGPARPGDSDRRGPADPDGGVARRRLDRARQGLGPGARRQDRARRSVRPDREAGADLRPGRPSRAAAPPAPRRAASRSRCACADPAGSAGRSATNRPST